MAGFRQDPIQLINLIADNLRDRYPDNFSILKELLQNADDAGAKEVHIGLSAGLPRTKHPLLQGPALFLLNDGPFSRRDYEAIQSFGLSNYPYKNSATGPESALRMATGMGRWSRLSGDMI